jgi:energy-coupling factor transporter ATP-binding protein EcfA2
VYIHRVRIARFRHIHNAEIGPLAPPPETSDLVALVGPNGSGKSSILELLGHALSNSWSLTWAIHRTFPQSSFEIEIGLTRDEITLLEERLEEPTGIQQTALAYLKERRCYSRSFGFEDGEYAADPALHNQAHSLVTATLRDHHNRALGFFLRSDRAYPFQTYNRRKLIEVTQRAGRKHLWGLAFNTSDIQYQDMYDFLVEQQYHYDRRLGSYLRRQRAGQLEEAEEEPEDPIEVYGQLLGRLFPGYEFVEAPTDIPDNLYVRIPSGERIAFQDLSSGEKEVFFILSFCLRSDVRNAIIVLDEPELHLHPELGRLLVRTMQDIRPGNQVWVGTHSGEIIDETGRDRLYFLSCDDETRQVAITPGTEESEATKLLRRVFGYSGYVGVARAMVFTEGRGTSVDRKVFAKIFSVRSGAVRIIPSGGSDTLPRINAAVLRILNATFSSCEFFLIRDRDYLTDDDVQAMVGDGDGRLWVLQRNQIENYLLAEEVISRVENDILGKSSTPEQVEADLRRAARNLAGETLREMLAFRMNRVFAPQDFSMDRMLQDQACIDEHGEWIDQPIQALKSRFQETVSNSLAGLEQAASSDSVERLVVECQDAVRSAVLNDGWRSLLPGKRLIEEYARIRGHPASVVPALTNSLVKYISTSPQVLDEELLQIIEAVLPEGEAAT